MESYAPQENKQQGLENHSTYVMIFKTFVYWNSYKE